jgi:hypothetical protein
MNGNIPETHKKKIESELDKKKIKKKEETWTNKFLLLEIIAGTYKFNYAKR